MPVLYEYKNDPGYYIKARPPGVGNITYKVKEEGYALVEDLDLVPEGDLSWEIINMFKVLGLVYTDESGVLGPDEGYEPDPAEIEKLSISEEAAVELLETFEGFTDLSPGQRDELCSILGIESPVPTEELPPNELADLYEALFTVLEHLPEGTHPGWEFAITSVLFGGDGLAPGTRSYGEQQATRNRFSIGDYRSQYGDGDHVTQFPAITTRQPNERDRTFADTDLRLPVAPDSDEVLPLYVDDNTFRDSISLLEEFPALPDAEMEGGDAEGLLNPERFPGIKSPTEEAEPSAESTEDEEGKTATVQIPPNELAELYEALFTVLKALPDSTDQAWREAIEAIVFGNEYLHAGARSYGEQQRDRNDFGMPEYREQYGDGEQVTDFQAITTGPPLEQDSQFLETVIRIPVSPESEEVLPLEVSRDGLSDALSLLAEFPAEPDADEAGDGDGNILDVEQLIADFEVEQPADESKAHQAETGTESGLIDQQSPTTAEADEHLSEELRQNIDESRREKVLRREGAGQANGPIAEAGHSADDTSRKYDDPRAERAHRRAQQRDPADVVSLGEEITLVLKEVDYAGYPPTIMGTKNKLVIFVVDAPQDLSKHDVIRAKVIDFGGNNNSAEAAFVSYAD